MNCHDNIHSNFDCFGGSYQPSEAIFGRMYKVNRKQARAPCVTPLIYSTSGRSRHPRRSSPCQKNYLCGDRNWNLNWCVCLCVRCGILLHWFNTCDEILFSLRLTQNLALIWKYLKYSSFNGTHIPYRHTKILDFSNSGSGTADYMAKMWYLRTYFSLQTWFFSDSGMLWYVICYYAMYF